MPNLLLHFFFVIEFRLQFRDNWCSILIGWEWLLITSEFEKNLQSCQPWTPDFVPIFAELLCAKKVLISMQINPIKNTQYKRYMKCWLFVLHLVNENVETLNNVKRSGTNCWLLLDIFHFKAVGLCLFCLLTLSALLPLTKKPICLMCLLSCLLER